MAARSTTIEPWKQVARTGEKMQSQAGVRLIEQARASGGNWKYRFTQRAYSVVSDGVGPCHRKRLVGCQLFL